LNETGWDCYSAETLESVEKQPGVSNQNVSTEYRFSLYGVDCADYCPEVCQFQFMTGAGCSAEQVSYELHANPMGYIRETAQWKYYFNWVWNETIPTWTHLHINHQDCELKLGNGVEWSDTFASAGCKKIPESFQQPTEIKSDESCLPFAHQGANTEDGTKAGGTHHGGR